MLNDVLGNEISIVIRKKPYPHIVADRLFKKEFVQTLRGEFNDRLKNGLSEDYCKNKFWKFGHYDAYCWTFNPETDQAFTDVFYSTQWRGWVNKFFDLELTPNVLGELHHHLVGSESGYIHNDYDPTSFVNKPLLTGMNPYRRGRVGYRGYSKVPGAIHCVRSLAMLYYFNNPPWEAGGESGLFAECKKSAMPVYKVEPLNNRLLVFEISPKSWHTFVSNTIHPRNGLVMWFHSTPAYMLKRYGVVAE